MSECGGWRCVQGYVCEYQRRSTCKYTRREEILMLPLYTHTHTHTHTHTSMNNLMFLLQVVQSLYYLQEGGRVKEEVKEKEERKGKWREEGGEEEDSVCTH